MQEITNGKVPCVQCGKPVSPTERDSYHEMYGWSRYRGKVGGTNALKWKRSTGKIMCAKCGFEKEQGITGQGSLL